MATKTYTISATGNIENGNISLTNDGFSPYELLGILELIKIDTLKKFNDVINDKRKVKRVKPKS